MFFADYSFKIPFTKTASFSQITVIYLHLLLNTCVMFLYRCRCGQINFLINFNCKEIRWSQIASCVFYAIKAESIWKSGTESIFKTRPHKSSVFFGNFCLISDQNFFFQTEWHLQMVQWQYISRTGVFFAQCALHVAFAWCDFLTITKLPHPRRSVSFVMKKWFKIFACLRKLLWWLSDQAQHEFPFYDFFMFSGSEIHSIFWFQTFCLDVGFQRKHVT